MGGEVDEAPAVLLGGGQIAQGRVGRHPFAPDLDGQQPQQHDRAHRHGRGGQVDRRGAAIEIVAEGAAEQQPAQAQEQDRRPHRAAQAAEQRRQPDAQHEGLIGIAVVQGQGEEPPQTERRRAEDRGQGQAGAKRQLRRETFRQAPDQPLPACGHRTSPDGSAVWQRNAFAVRVILI